MTRIRNVGGKIIETTGGNDISYAKENIVFNSAKKITFTGVEKGVTFGEPDKAPKKEQVISLESELCLHNNQELKVPYIDVSGILNYKSSKPFIASIKTIFGDDIKHQVIKRFMIDLIKNKVPYPKFEINDNLSNGYGGYYSNGVISLNETLILQSEKDLYKSWLLFRVIMEEIAHYIDDLLRNKYDNIGGDSPKNEGVLLTALFVKFNNLLFKDFEFAKIKVKSKNGDIREFTAKVLENNPTIEFKAKELLFVAKNEDDHGVVTLKSGKKINVKFFKIAGGGAIHEDITQRAAKAVDIKYDKRLDEGCAWPDVPCEDENSIETCYYNTWDSEHKKGTKAYESHHGSKQYWHSMAPAGNHTNQGVINLIVEQAKIWFKKGFETKISDGFFGKGDDDGLFHIGKILHMVQDSYSLSHVERDINNNVIQFQGYDAQDPDKHGTPDKDNKAKGVNDAFLASVWILSFYKTGKEKKADLSSMLLNLEKHFRTKIYALAPNRGEVKAGGSLDAYKKEEKK
jgi:hypothetical protein